VIRRAIKVFEADLTDLTVLTEAGSRYFVFTPLIAALAGAKEVLVFCRDSRYGSRQDILANLRAWAAILGIADRIVPITERSDTRIGQADIVTNLGFVRPIDAELIGMLGTTAAIPLMWETWEYRPQDLDLTLARERNIPVLGTNESDPRLRTMEYVGVAALKALLNCGIEALGSHVLIVGSGAFAQACRDVMARIGAVVTLVDSRDADYGQQATREVIGQDVVIVAEHLSRRCLLGSDGLDLSQIVPSQRPSLIVHVAGEVERLHCERYGVPTYPETVASNGYMSLATDTVGPKPVIDLHTAGLVVGASMSLNARRGLRGIEAEWATLAALPFAQGFSDRHEARI
jgi:hypothetical protein